MSADERPYPPSLFNISEFVFRPGIPYIPRPGLLERVEAMSNERRFRSALQLLLPILGEAPHDQEALSLALIVLGQARTEHVQADEALGHRYLLDRGLDPVFAVCSHCTRISWAAHQCLTSHGRPHSTINNPIGLQCWGCGYVLCRNCYRGMTNCPNCGSAELRAPVYPTGRHARQLDRRASPVACTIVMREGPIDPDREWIEGLMDSLSPDVLEDESRILGYGIHPWRPDIGDIGLALAARVQASGEYGQLRFDNLVSAEVKSPDGLRVFVVKLYA